MVKHEREGLLKQKLLGKKKDSQFQDWELGATKKRKITPYIKTHYFTSTDTYFNLRKL